MLRDVVNRQEKIWAKDWSILSGPQATLENPLQKFEQAFREAITTECQRNYRAPARREAATHFPQGGERNMIADVFKDALRGMLAKDLASQLARLPRRGER